MAEAFLETTNWDGKALNHVYLMEGDKAIAYQNALTGQVLYFTTPYQLIKRGRTFVKAVLSPFKASNTPGLIEVKGSKGETYYVNPVEKSCTCSGYIFRSKCKHIDAAGK